MKQGSISVIFVCFGLHVFDMEVPQFIGHKVKCAHLVSAHQ